MHFTHQHTGKIKGPLDCLSHSLEPLYYPSIRTLFLTAVPPLAGKCRTLQAGFCLALASLDRSPTDHLRSVWGPYNRLQSVIKEISGAWRVILLLAQSYGLTGHLGI